jgi:redox-sensitive bicupin YhaK (pirin superfamily)
MSTLPANEPSCLERSDDPAIELVIEGRPREVGTITVARLLPSPKRQMVGPFIFVDHMGPIVLAPEVGFDIRPHPHIGLSTVTYFLAGENVHRDSLGTTQVNRPGDLNLMTAGRGIVHSERADPRFRASGGAMHGVQIWLALPDAREDDAPSFEHHPEATLPAIAPAPGVRGRVLLGGGSPVRHPSAPQLVDLQLDPGASLELTADGTERGLFVIEGALDVDGEPLSENQLAVLGARGRVRATARSRVRAMLLGGPAMPPRFIQWNFVASSRERIARARDAWKARQFPVIPTDDQEFIPWPDDQR